MWLNIGFRTSVPTEEKMLRLKGSTYQKTTMSNSVRGHSELSTFS
jgi:hypothetical protein